MASCVPTEEVVVEYVSCRDLKEDLWPQAAY